MIVILSCLGAKSSVSLCWFKIILVPVCSLSWRQILYFYSLRAKSLDAKSSWCQIVLKPSKLNLYITFLNLYHIISYATICWFYNSLHAIFNIGYYWDLIEEVQLNSWIGQITPKLDWITLEETSNLSLFMIICCVTNF